MTTNKDRFAVASLIVGISAIAVGLVEPEIRCFLKLPLQDCAVAAEKTRPEILSQPDIKESICLTDRQS